ncbi:MAG: pentapeptide repeat-containing protein [Ruminococcus sp.]|nr:pentapeptide repeat-containing protein [Ruminococcus sp.]
MAALKCNYCKNSEFKVVDEKIICKTCNKEVNDNEKKFFVLKTENKLCAKLLGFAVGTAVVAVGACVEPLISPFVLPAIIKHFKPFVENIGSYLSESLESTVYSEGTYGKQLTDIFDKELKKICKIGSKQSSGKYLNFYNYCCYCQINYVDVIEKIIEKEIFVDIFTEDAIRVIISEENHYPGYIDEPQILENVISVSKELNIRYKNKIYEQRDLCIQWLIEKNSANIETNFSDIKNQIENLSNFFKAQVKSSCISDDLYEYIKSYNRPLFLEDDTGVSLGEVYVDPVIEGTENRITDEIYDWYEYGDEKILIVNGAAGIGKTSLVSRLIADTYGTSDFNNKLNKEKVFPIILRSNIEYFENASSNKTPIAIIKDILDVRSEDIQNSLIILDGFDELALLSKGFDCKKFLYDLIGDLENLETTKVLITSRPMNEIDKDIENVEFKSVVWEKAQILAWCEKFKNVSEKDSEKHWCDSFIVNYDNLAQNDSDGNKMDIFKAPMILYLACHSNSQISANETVGEFYDRVFRAIASREHLKKHIAPNVLKNESEKENIINWQFTKELAYQMFLHDTLILSDSELIKNAEKRTIDVLKEKRPDIVADKKDFKIDKLKYLAVTHFAKETTNEKGIEFAHKTVYEYFTAVKLYEDYFAEITEDYPEPNEDHEMFEKVWTNIIEAFRYASIDESIFNYLNKMERPIYNGTSEDEGKGFNFEKFEHYFVEGMRKCILSDLPIKRPVKEYKLMYEWKIKNNIFLEKYRLFTTQIGCAFRNLTCFLSGHGYRNKDDIDECKNIKELISCYYSDLNLKKWKLSGANLKNLNLKGAVFSYADLSCSVLIGSDLSNAKFISTRLEGTDLRNTIYDYVSFENAKYCEEYYCKTKFPEEFDPKEHGMIEVDQWGKQIK